MAKKKEVIKKKIIIKAVSQIFKCSHCSSKFEEKVDNSMNPVNCPSCNSSAVVRI